MEYLCGMKRPLIFISNDDGVSSPGIGVLIRLASEFGDVFVVAPDSPRSGSGCALTPYSPVMLTSVSDQEGVQIFSCTGTPVDCIKLGKQVLRTEQGRVPDLVLAGINHGDNSGINVHYSGTMGIAIEGCISGVPSVGFSIDNHSANADFSHTEDVIRQVIERVLREGLPAGTCLNVNFPASGPLKGLLQCRQGMGRWTMEWEACTHPRGGRYYWLTGDLNKDVTSDEQTDFRMVQQGYAAITPIRIDMTDDSYQWSV